jgi:hypothetical protein
MNTYPCHCEPFAFCHPEGALRPCHPEETFHYCHSDPDPESDEGEESSSGQAPRPKDLPQGKLRVTIWSHPHLASPIPHIPAGVNPRWMPAHPSSVKGEGNVEGALLFLPPLAGGS